MDRYKSIVRRLSWSNVNWASTLTRAIGAEASRLGEEFPAEWSAGSRSRC
jgi:hypothetical protein